MTDPRALLESIVLKELERLKTWSDGDGLTSEQVEKLEVLAKVLRHTAEGPRGPAEDAPASGPSDVAAALALVDP